MSTSPISDEERNRFLREIIANSPDTGITPAEQDQALRAFIHMLIDRAVIAMWAEGGIQMGWEKGQLIYHLKPVEAAS
ncbi:hypothetical protein [Mycobacterium sp. TY813]|uniref:hypothetical protein n=1 Tax=Mycobacterium TaxID=1763 RepID=UPI0027420C6A|nr:hypothetical protein [Mycobacterium sp. TY813]MDP7731504.1 hypothetical protein [Mycobacterium sp. TY813]